jgi:hypothetical protein
MLWSKLFIPTLRANPAGESPGRQLLQRAGYLRGADRWLFLARRSSRKIVKIAREEFDAAGAQEMLLPDSGACRSGRSLPPRTGPLRSQLRGHRKLIRRLVGRWRRLHRPVRRVRVCGAAGIGGCPSLASRRPRPRRRPYP